MNNTVIGDDSGPWASFSDEEFDEAQDRAKRLLFAAEDFRLVPLEEVDEWQLFRSFVVKGQGIRPENGIRGLHTVLDALEAAMARLEAKS